jgi:hypothetical protein
MSFAKTLILTSQVLGWPFLGHTFKNGYNLCLWEWKGKKWSKDLGASQVDLIQQAAEANI